MSQGTEMIERFHVRSFIVFELVVVTREDSGSLAGSVLTNGQLREARGQWNTAVISSTGDLPFNLIFDLS